MVKPNKNKQTKKQIACSMALEKRKTKRRLSGSGETEITQVMIDDKLASSCVDRIQGMLPKPKQKRPPTQQQGPKNPRPWTALPAKPLKRNVLWMTMKEQDPSSTMSLSDEIKSFAAYVSLDVQEEASRKNLLYDVQDVVTSKWSHSAVQPFGSYPVGLSIFLSDIDVSILGMGVDDDDVQQQQQQQSKLTALYKNDMQQQQQQQQPQSKLTALYNKFLDSGNDNNDKSKLRGIKKETVFEENNDDKEEVYIYLYVYIYASTYLHLCMFEYICKLMQVLSIYV
jgi:DNA polymerase sigma